MMTRIFFASLWLFNIAARTAALNANKNSGFTTYNDRWRAFEVVTQGDQVGTYTFPGQLDGIGVSVAIGVAVYVIYQCLNLTDFDCCFANVQAYLLNITHIRVLVNHELPWSCGGTASASVSEIIIDKASLMSAINNMGECFPLLLRSIQM